MLRYCLPIILLAAITFFTGGCRSCSDCHDYDPPVANCDCDAYGTHRAGSVSACGGGCCGCGVGAEGPYEPAIESAPTPAPCNCH